MKKIKKFAPGRTSPAAKLLSIFLTATVIWWFWGDRIKGFLGMGEKPSARQESIKTEAPAESSGKDADSKKGLSEQTEQINQRISGFASSLSAVQEEMDRDLNEALKASDRVLLSEVTAREGLFEKGYKLLKTFSGEKPKGEYLIRGEELDRIAKRMTDMGYKPYYTRDSGNIKMMYIREWSPEGGR